MASPLSASKPSVSKLLSVIQSSCRVTCLSRLLIASLVLILSTFAPAAWAEDLESSSTECPEGQADCRSTFYADLRLGWLVDTFAADGLRSYLNPDDSSATGTELAAGFALEYRLLGNDWEPNKSQLWLYGQSIYGVRTADVDCADHTDLSVCEFAASPTDSDPGTVVESAIYLLTHATSLEVYSGLRWEPRAYRVATDAPIRPYVKLELGFINVEGAGSESLERNQLAAGFTLTRGSFIGTFFELGYGTSDLYVTDPDNRLKIQAMLRWQTAKGFGAFAQLEAEFDQGSGADSIRSMIGFSYDLSRPLLGSNN